MTINEINRSRPFVPSLNGTAIQVPVNKDDATAIQAVLDFVDAVAVCNWGIDDYEDVYVEWNVTDDRGMLYRRRVQSGDYITKSPQGELRAWYGDDFPDLFGTA